jgi:hypothetical protein
MTTDHISSDPNRPSESTQASFPIVASAAIAEAIDVANNQATIRMFTGSKSSGNLKVGELLVLEGNSFAIVGEVSRLTVVSTKNGPETYAHVALMATLNPKTGALTPGVSDSVSLGGRAYRPHPEIIKAVIEDRQSVLADERGQLKLSLARPAHHDDISLSFSPEKIMGRHCAILGTSGAGKSWSVARVIEECGKHRSKIILLDPTGEYEPLDGNIFHVHLGHAHRQNVRSVEAAIPYKELTEADLVEIFRPTNGSQILKLRSAMKTLKLLQHETKLAAEGTMLKAHKSKVVFEAAMQQYKAEIDNPKNTFDIAKLPLQIEFECVDPIRSQTEPSYWGGINSADQSACVPMVNRILDLLASDDLRCIFKPAKQPSIFDAITRFFQDPRVSILRVSFEFLPTNHRVREIVANSLGRYLLQMGRSGAFRERPLVVVLDEAHQALNSQLSDMSHDFPLEAFNIIAKEGRKYGLTMCLATQRPRDIPDDVLSQVGTFIVHRLVNDADRTTIERASGTANEILLESLPSLAPGESFFIGIDFPTPLRVKMLKPEHPPRSAGPNYQAFWSNGKAD